MGSALHGTPSIGGPAASRLHGFSTGRASFRAEELDAANGLRPVLDLLSRMLEAIGPRAAFVTDTELAEEFGLRRSEWPP
jgi:hypothetical protein